MIYWVNRGDVDLGVLEAGHRLYACVKKDREGWFQLEIVVPRLRNERWQAAKKITLMRWAERYARANKAYVERTVAYPLDPYEPPIGQEAEFFDSIWPGYRPAGKKRR